MAHESDLDKEILDLIRSRGGWAVKVHGGQFMPAGTPDILACYKQKFVAVEDKVDGNTARGIQVKTLRDIASAGGYAFVAYSVEEVAAALDAIDALATQSIQESACPKLSPTFPSYRLWQTGNVPPLVRLPEGSK